MRSDMSFNLRREISVALQYLVFTIIAGGYALSEWRDRCDIAKLEHIPDGSSLVIDYSNRMMVHDIIKYYCPPLVEIFLTLVAVRLLIVYVLSLRQKRII